MPIPSPSAQSIRHLDATERAWLEQAAKEARGEWRRARSRGSLIEKAQALACLSGILCDLEGPEVSLRLSRRAHRLWKGAGDPKVVAVSSAVLAVRLLDADRTDEALRQSALALADMRGLEIQDRHLGVCHNLGKAFLLAGFAVEAQSWLDLALESPAYDERANLLALLSTALDLLGQPQEARARLREACAAYDDQWDQAAMAKAMLRLARLELRLSNPWEASVLCQEAMRFLGGFPSDLAQAHELFGLCKALEGRRFRGAGHRKLQSRRNQPEEY